MNFFREKKAPCNENDLGENIKLDRLIVMDDVLGLAERSETFANFFGCFKKIRSDVCLYFLYNSHDKAKLANDTCTDKNL